MTHLVGASDWRMRVPDRPWDAPPDAFDQIRRQGFQDGIEGARRDLDNHRQPNVENRDEYRRPNVPPQMWEQYREGFRRGYNAAMSRLMSSQQWQAPPPPRPWNVAPDDFDVLHRQGFQDGVLGAQKDIDNHRRPDVNNREEYRNSPICPRRARSVPRWFSPWISSGDKPHDGWPRPRSLLNNLPCTTKPGDYSPGFSFFTSILKPIQPHLSETQPRAFSRPFCEPAQ